MATSKQLYAVVFPKALDNWACWAMAGDGGDEE